MYDTMPMEFVIPASIVLWLLVLILWLRDRAIKRRLERRLETAKLRRMYENMKRENQ